MNKYLRMAANTLQFLLEKSNMRESEELRKVDHHEMAKKLRNKNIYEARKANERNPRKSRAWRPVPGSKVPIKPMKPFK